MNIYRTNKPFRILANAAFLSNIGSVMFNFVFMIYAQTLPFKTLALSLVTLANLLPTLVTMPSGYLADHTPAQRRFSFMFWLRLVQAALYVGLAIIIQAPGTLATFAILLAINVGSDLIADFTGNLIFHYQKHILHSQDEYQSGLGFLSGVGNIISMVFQAVGTSLILMLHHNYVAFGLINAASFALAALVLLQGRHQFKAADTAAAAEQVEAAPENMVQGFKRAMQFMVQDRALFAIIILAVGVNALGTSIDGLLSVLIANTTSLWFAHDFGVTLAIIGISASLSTTVAALFMHDGLQHWSLPALTMITTGALALLALDLVVWQNNFAMVALLVIACYPIGKINPRLSAEIMSRVDNQHLATVASALQTLIMIGAPAGTALFLGIANLSSPTLAWTVLGGCAVLITLLAAWMRRFTAAPQPTEEA